MRGGCRSWLLVLLCGLVSGEEVCKPWRPKSDIDVSRHDLTRNFASNAEGIDPRECENAIEFVDAEVSLLRFQEWRSEGINQAIQAELELDLGDGFAMLWMALNGESEGVVFALDKKLQGNGCFGSIAHAAAEELIIEEDDAIVAPKRLLSSMGFPIRDWDDIEEGEFALHVLLDRESWVWPGIEVGFTRTVTGKTLKTVSMSPRVLVVEDLVGEEDAVQIIQKGSKSLHRSPEKHYSDDPKFKNYRTSETGILNDDVIPEATRLRLLCQDILRLEDISYVEPLQLLKYDPGKWYKEHYDVFHNIKPLTRFQEYVQLEHVPETAAEWAIQQQHILLAMYLEDIDDEEDEDEETSVILKGKQLFLSPNSEWFPLPSKKWVKQKEIVETHIEWIRGVWCGDNSECVAEVAEILDDLEEERTELKERALHRNRHVTMLPYLNNVDGGGATVFPLASRDPEMSLFGPSNDREAVNLGMDACGRGFQVPAQKGAAAIFYHTNPSSTEIDKLSLHGGCPPIRSNKFAINVFTWNLNWNAGISLSP